MMSDLYGNYENSLTHNELFGWHRMLMNGRSDLSYIGNYRNDDDPMQIVSGRLDRPKIHFEAPPSRMVQKEMDRFVTWFNSTAKGEKNVLPPLVRAGIAHLYFVTIHPFEDGNGRIARALVIKSLSQSLGKPLFTSFSTVIHKGKKDYYNVLEASNKTNDITNWLIYFSKTLISAQNYTQQLIEFLITKAKLFESLKGKINSRQEKVLIRIFKEGVEGFKGGLSAENYISISGATRPTATRDLNDLVAKNALIKTGELKGSRYHLNLKFFC